MRVLLTLLKGLALLLAVAVAALMVVRLMFPLPDISGRATQLALPPTQSPPPEAASGDSGVLPLADGREALRARLALAEKATRSIDAQYYIWHDDTSGMILLEELAKAADRGVRVRLLLDDNGIPGMDDIIATLNAKPQFEIRLFNPSTIRHPKPLGYAIAPIRMNRRMHNKSFIVDGGLAIIGGRNIGDEYFQIGAQFYIDMDALVVGDVVAQTVTTFDDYWNSASVFAAEDIITAKGDETALAARFKTARDNSDGRDITADMDKAHSQIDRPAFEWTKVELIADRPEKGAGTVADEDLMVTRLGEVISQTRTRFDLASAYFVPGKKGTQWLGDLARSGKDVRILTNALNTTDVLPVHAGYSKYRRDLLEAGVRLYELKLRGEVPPLPHGKITPIGLSGASLHAKTFAIDDEKIFIGSFNFDPRSILLNCEMGYLIHSPTLASRISKGFDGSLASVTYQPQLTPKGKMVWQEQLDQGKTVIYQEEPGASWGQQIALTFIGLLPVEWLL